MALAELFEKELLSRCSFAGARNSGDDLIAELSAAQIYKSLGRSAPAIIWCRSPYQMATLPSILIGLFFSDAWQIVSGVLAEREIDEHWEHDFEESWEALWAHGGQQLLQGMKHTSRIATQYWELEAELYQQCKMQLRNWLKSGKLHAFEEKLPKQIIYRKFWALQLWHLNFVVDRLRILSPDLLSELFNEQNLWENQWTQFQPYLQRLMSVYSGAGFSLDLLVSRMGAEPANQLKHCVWLPMSLPAVSLSQIWIDNVHKQALTNFVDEVAAWDRLSKSTIGVICLDNAVFACEKPTFFAVDEGGRMHNATGPAIVFSDGFCEYAWHGIVVEPRIINAPETITIQEIENAANAELRRILIERYGQSRYLQDSGAEQIHEDDFGVLFSKEIQGDEPLVMVRVVNSTPEPDGSFKDYFLRVPPYIETARQAVAWTFGVDEEDYMPLVES